MREAKGIEPRYAAVAAGMVAIIVYGSLFPFDFYRNPNPAGPLGTLLASWRGLGDRADFIANTFLYLPLGFFLAQAPRGWPRIPRILVATAAGICLSVCIELTQFYAAGRLTNLDDVYSNGLGTLAGAIAAALAGGKLSRIRTREWRPFVVLMIASCVGSGLYPYIPAFDLHKYWHAVTPLMTAQTVPLLDVYRFTVTWLSLGLLVESLFGVTQGRGMLALLYLATGLAQIVVKETRLLPAEVAGATLGVVLWIVLVSRLRLRALLVAVLFVAMVALVALAPFTFTTTPHRMGLIPFKGFIAGPRDNSVRVFLEKTFIYGTLLWVLGRAGCSARLATLFAGGLVLGLRVLQIYLPRSAEITDFVMVLMLAGVMKAMHESPWPQMNANERE